MENFGNLLPMEDTETKNIGVTMAGAGERIVT
jgi:hypothetical protein